MGQLYCKGCSSGSVALSRVNTFPVASENSVTICCSCLRWSSSTYSHTQPYTAIQLYSANFSRRADLAIIIYLKKKPPLLKKKVE